MKTVLLDRQQSLVQWVSQATGINTFGVKVRLRGNDLHILCEGTECPERWRTLSDLLQALQQTDLDHLTNNEQPSIYQVFVYGRRKGEQRPKWCHRVYLNQIEKHLEQVEQALLADSENSKQPGGALIVSNESLARQGNPDAIARYLSETLSMLGVSVQAKIKLHKPKNSQPEENRLWIFCQSSYSPDPSLLAEPIAQKLRYLKLSGYQDAVIVSQVSGETAPDWLLRVDLTPPEVMLKEWARWGDVQAIARLLTEVLSGLKVAVQASLKESTLHIFCTPAFDALGTAPVPDKTVCLEAILPQLEAIAPQGILAATIYGQKAGDNDPTWIDWLDLPAKKYPVFATSALDLANSGDEPAIVFLLERLLNPDLDWRLLTGGIRVLLLNKGDLLHIMCDAPVCPARTQVANKVTQFIRQLKIPGIKGVRVYGRRAGNKEPFWHHGIDLGSRQRLVPEATPEFAATSQYINDLVTSETSEPILRPDLTTEEVQTFVTEIARNWLVTANTTAKKFLLATQLFSETQQPAEGNSDPQGMKIALVWGTLGLLLTLQSDWVLGQIIARNTPNSPTVASVSPASSSGQKVSLISGKNQSQKTTLFATTSKRKSSSNQNSVFNASEFTQTDETQNGNLAAAPLKEKATATAILLAARSQIPSFNVRQLDEQLALYKQRLARTGSPPDILIIGSSRALRGVDPAELSKALATQGYPNLDVFNFGINGATAQVVNFVICEVLEPSELPKIIIWADGARAFNSGREDITFKSIASSAGYKQALQKTLTTPNSSDLPENHKNSPEQKIKEEKPELNGYQAVNDWLNQSLASVSTSYQNRDQIKSLLQKQLLKLSPNETVESQKQLTDGSSQEDASKQAVDFDGFLALSVRFHPARYYQKYSRVPGNYDNDYKSFQVEGEQDAAFQQVLNFTQSQKISLVFVNMPLTGEYLDPVRRKYEQQFQQYMLRLATNPNFIYRDLSQQWLKVNDYFSDPSHLNRFGAYEVSKKLANDPMIPWIVK
ncbi:D-alanyl-lipoteichoic acid biosynthesis protein DltD [Nostoc sp. C117]|uniref:D-alanyl-lipoteichoic acid biosynthesis protein DltD n=1 Tax=Nostoc sp. C117 TaxID=3349875 RepID=UPI00370CFD62